MRERQYSFVFRGNRPSTPFAGNTAQDFARSRRKLDLSELVFGTFLAEILAESFRVEAAGWKGRTGSALLSDPHRRQFYEKYATIASEKGILRLSFIRIGGEVAATQIAVESGGRFWLLKVGYDERFARCSPGHLLMVETLRYAAERGLRTFEFLGSAEPWTQVWRISAFDDHVHGPLLLPRRHCLSAKHLN